MTIEMPHLKFLSIQGWELGLAVLQKQLHAFLLTFIGRAVGLE